METDVLVIGGGFAGLTAAARAAELGLKVLVLEQGSLPDYLCNSRISGGHLHICRDNPVADVEYLKAKIQSVTDNFADPELVKRIDAVMAQVKAGLAKQPAPSARSTLKLPAKS